ncbi:phosphonate C-P lyase system protein PhnL [Desertibaculum subflavum]|uniref:phosphonate C-P lyase system protein PhnL n=1 Tax=Desertibaculum subflavum TaxID=2268458 RepID=UPI000E668FC5
MPDDKTVMIAIESLAKTFTLHLRGSVELRVLQAFSMQVETGECVVLRAPSGTGKSTVLRSVSGNYRIGGGRVAVRHEGEMVDLSAASPRTVMEIRRNTIGYVSQFLRVIPRVSALDVVAEPLMARGVPTDEARERAGTMLGRLHIPAKMWDLPPATFSGGEQQRVNIARVLAVDYPILLLDEPTASLDDANRALVLDLVREARERGAAILAILHDEASRAAVATRYVDLAPLEAAA